MGELREINCEPPPSEECLRILDMVSEMARKGELSSVAIAVVKRDGSHWTTWSASPSFATLLGAVSRLAYRMNQQRD